MHTTAHLPLYDPYTLQNLHPLKVQGLTQICPLQKRRDQFSCFCTVLHGLRNTDKHTERQTTSTTGHILRDVQQWGVTTWHDFTTWHEVWDCRQNCVRLAACCIEYLTVSIKPYSISDVRRPVRCWPHSAVNADMSYQRSTSATHGNTWQSHPHTHTHTHTATHDSPNLKSLGSPVTKLWMTVQNAENGVV